MTTQQHVGVHAPVVTTRPLEERDLPEADRIFRMAFGTFLGLPDPLAFGAESPFITTRWRADPSRAFAAERAGVLVGTNVATQWGSVGSFGPLTVLPEYWDQGVGSRLMEPILERFTTWGVRHAGLFTFAQSPKHLALYQKFGFYPRFLTTLLVKPVAAAPSSVSWTRFSGHTGNGAAAALGACREVTEAIYDGLDLSIELRAVQEQQLGDTVLLWHGSQLAGFACCHCGPGSEAGAGTCYIKFGAVRPGADAAARFGELLQACDALAAERGLSTLMGGVNLGRDEAYRHLLAAGYRMAMAGVAMQRPNEPGYNRSGVYLIDDWR